MFDADLIATILNNVGPLYENIVASIQACETPISYAALAALLLNAERRHLTFPLTEDTSLPSMTAMVANRGRGGGRSGGVRDGGRTGFLPRLHGSVAGLLKVV